MSEEIRPIEESRDSSPASSTSHTTQPESGQRESTSPSSSTACACSDCSSMSREAEGESSPFADRAGRYGGDYFRQFWDPDSLLKGSEDIPPGQDLNVREAPQHARGGLKPPEKKKPYNSRPEGSTKNPGNGKSAEGAGSQKGKEPQAGSQAGGNQAAAGSNVKAAGKPEEGQKAAAANEAAADPAGGGNDAANNNMQMMQMMTQMMGQMMQMMTTMMTAMMSMMNNNIKPTPGPTPNPTPNPSPNPSPSPSPNPGPHRFGNNVNWMNWDAKKNSGDQGGGSFLNDIESHIDPKHGGTYRDKDKVTWSHETTHGINSDISNKVYDGGKRKTGLYVGNNKAIALENPDMKKSDVKNHIPESLKGSRYNLYLNQQQSFENEPHYLLDEWVSYTNGLQTGVELGKMGQGRADNIVGLGVNGAQEFTAYAFAEAKACAEKDPGYWNSEKGKQFKEFLAWNGLRSMNLVREGNQLEKNKEGGQDKYLQDFQTGSDAQGLRDFIAREFGQDYLKALLYG